MKKFTFEHSLHHMTVSDIHQFIVDVKEGKLKQSLKTAAVPKSNNNPVKKVVGSTFNTIVRDRNKDVFVIFTSPTCAYCQSLKPIWESLAKKVAGAPDLIIAEMDATENDAEDVSIK
jgi:protein disulfide-isomerase A1